MEMCIHKQKKCTSQVYARHNQERLCHYETQFVHATNAGGLVVFLMKVSKERERERHVFLHTIDANTCYVSTIHVCIIYYIKLQVYTCMYIHCT